MIYDRTTIWLHWLTAILIGVLWGLAQIIDFWPSGGIGRVVVRSIHMTLGLILAGLITYRIIWRNSQGRQLPPAETGILGLASKLIHLALYTLVIIALISGITNAWVRGDSIFGLFRLPSFAPGDRPTRQLINAIHDITTNIILITAALHAAAALFHHLIRRDGVLRRMVPWG